MSRVSPLILLVIILIAIGFFVIGFLHLLIRCFTRQQQQSTSLRDPPAAFQRQLQHLFQMHDSGLDQAAIDALPVFLYREITGANEEAFDCAVCLCEFSEGDRLKLIPTCSHAFHIHCIDTWLLSNSTCPLCRSLIGTQWTSHSPPPNAGPCPSHLLSVRLGKFRSTDKGLADQNSGSNNIDARRCFSMGAFQYITVDTKLQVALSKPRNEQLGNRRIHPRTRDDSFSLSKIWLWSNKHSLSTPSGSILTSTNFTSTPT